jgi:hypothetical protein
MSHDKCTKKNPAFRRDFPFSHGFFRTRDQISQPGLVAATLLAGALLLLAGLLPATLLLAGLAAALILLTLVLVVLVLVRHL